MPITHDGRFHVTGFTESIPCDFEDVYNAAMAGGWGGATKQGNQYYFTKSIVIGDGTIATYFADTQVHVEHNASETFFIQLKPNGHYRLGEVVNTSQKTSKNGCSIKSSTRVGYSLHVDGNCQFEFYSCLLDSAKKPFRQTNQILNTHINRIWNTTWLGHYPSIVNGIPDVDIYRSNVENGVCGFSSRGEQKDLITSSTNYGILFAYTTTELVVSGLQLQECYRDFACMYSPNVTINVDDSQSTHGDAWLFAFMASSGCNIVRRYKFRMEVKDDLGNVVIGADVEIKDLAGNVVFSDVTDGDGCINTILHHGYFPTTSTEVWETPHTYKVSKAGTNLLDVNGSTLMNDAKLLEVTMVDMSDLIQEINEIKGTGFELETDSLRNIEANMETLLQITKGPPYPG